jgi:hypothetical protein
VQQQREPHCQVMGGRGGPGKGGGGRRFHKLVATRQLAATLLICVASSSGSMWRALYFRRRMQWMQVWHSKSPSCKVVCRQSQNALEAAGFAE